MDSSIGYQLGIGSGLDVRSMVAQLAEAQKAPRQALIDRREALNEARISSLAEIGGAIDSFASSLKTLISGGSLFTQPTVSEPTLVGAKAVAGARLGGLTAELEVVQLAKAQTLESARLASPAAPVGEGTLTLNTAAGSVAIVIDATNNSLQGLADAINAADRGVAASIVTDAAGARLVLKGQTGAASAFSLDLAAGDRLQLGRFAFETARTDGMAQAQAAQDAIVRLDGVEVSRDRNSFSDLVKGVQIDLKKAAPGTLVSLGTTRPTAEIEQGINDFVAAYNEVMGMISAATKAGAGADAGPLRGDIGIATLQRRMRELTSTPLTMSGNGPHTLAEIGVRTNRDGTLSVDSFRLKQQLTDNADAVEALFNPSQWTSSAAATITSGMGRVKPGTYTLTDLVPQNGIAPASGKVDGIAMTGVGPNLVAPSTAASLGLIVRVEAAAASVTVTVEAGLGGALQAIRDALRDRGGPFATTNTRLQKEGRAIASDEAELEERSERFYNQLLKTFTAMEKQVSAFKATQSYLDQQVKIWTNDRN